MKSHLPLPDGYYFCSSPLTNSERTSESGGLRGWPNSGGKKVEKKEKLKEKRRQSPQGSHGGIKGGTGSPTRPERWAEHRAIEPGRGCQKISPHGPQSSPSQGWLLCHWVSWVSHGSSFNPSVLIYKMMPINLPRWIILQNEIHWIRGAWCRVNAQYAASMMIATMVVMNQGFILHVRPQLYLWNESLLPLTKWAKVLGAKWRKCVFWQWPFPISESGYANCHLRAYILIQVNKPCN